MSPQSKSKALVAAKLLLGISLIAMLLNTVDIAVLLDRFRSINITYLILVFILPHVAMLLSTVKWRILLDALGIRVGLLRLFNLYMIGTFFSNFLPTMVGGDVVKSYTLYRETGDAASVLAATFLDRFIGLTALVSILPLVLFQETVINAIPMLNLLVTGIMVSYLLVLAAIASPISLYFGKLPKTIKLVGKVLSFVDKTHSNIRRFRKFKGPLISSYLISLAFYFVTVATTWTATRALGVNMEFLYLAAIVPIVLLAGSLPVSLNGLGITETGYVMFFLLVGVAPEDALAIALLLRVRLLITALLGGLIFLRYRSHTNQIARPYENNDTAEVAHNPDQHM